MSPRDIVVRPPTEADSVRRVGRDMEGLSERLVHLTGQLNTWRSEVEGALVDNEGAKVDFATWAGGMDAAHDEQMLRLANIEAATQGIQTLRTSVNQMEGKLRGEMEELAQEVAKEVQPKFEEAVGKAIEEHLASQLENHMQQVLQRTSELIQPHSTDLQDLREIAGGLTEQMNQQREALKPVRNSVTSMTSELLRMKREVENLKRPPGTSAAAPPPLPFVAPPIPAPPASPPIPVGNIRWTRVLAKLNYSSVRSFAALFEAYLKATNMPEAQAKIVLLQSLENEALHFVSAFADSASVADILKRLLARVRPSEHVMMKRLLDTKQKSTEPIAPFTSRFTCLSNELPGYTDSRLRDIYVDNVLGHWRRTARSILLHDPHMTLQRLSESLLTLEGSDAADMMEIDAVRVPEQWTPEIQDPVEVSQVILPGGRVNWTEVSDQRSLMMAWRAMMRNDASLREECISWLNRKPNDSNRRQTRGRPNGNPRQQNRILNVEAQEETAAEESHDQIFDLDQEPVESVTTRPTRRMAHTGEVKVVYRSTEHSKPSSKEAKKLRQMSRPLPICHMRFARNPLMYVQAKLNGIGVQSLVDTGAATSILPMNKAKKLGVAVDTTKTVELLAFDGSVSSSSGVAKLRVSLGDREFDNEFCVVPSKDTKLIFGNDIWKAQGIIIDPAANELRLAADVVVPCQAVKRRPLVEENISEAVPQLKATEPQAVDPVVKDNVLLIPAAKSFVRSAKSSKTIVVPLQYSTTTPVYDSGRLPPGILTATTIWSRHQRLRLTLTNTTPRSVMVGSKSAVGAVVIDSEAPKQMIDHTGSRRVIRRV